MSDRPIPPLPHENPPGAELRWARLEAKSQAMVEELVERCSSQRPDAQRSALYGRSSAAYVVGMVVALIWLWLR